MNLADRAEQNAWSNARGAGFNPRQFGPTNGQMAAFNAQQSLRKAEEDAATSRALDARLRVYQDPTHPDNPANVRARGQAFAAAMADPNNPLAAQMQGRQERAQARRDQMEQIRQQRIRYEQGRHSTPDEAMMFAMRDAIRVNPIAAMQMFGSGMHNLGLNQANRDIAQTNADGSISVAGINADAQKYNSNVLDKFYTGQLANSRSELDLRREQGDRDFGLRKIESQAAIDDRVAKNNLALIEMEDKRRKLTPEGRAESARQAALEQGMSPQEAEMEARKVRGEIPTNSLSPIQYEQAESLAKEFMQMKPGGTSAVFRDYLASKGFYIEPGQGGTSYMHRGYEGIKDLLGSWMYGQSGAENMYKDNRRWDLMKDAEGMPQFTPRQPGTSDPIMNDPLWQGQQKAMQQRHEQLDRQRQQLESLSQLSPEQMLQLRLQYPLGQFA